MAFTWTGDPSASVIEQIRWEINDIDEANAKFQDAEITYAYNQEHSVLGASARLCEQLEGRYSDAADRTMGPLRVDMTKKAELYAKKADRLRKLTVRYAKPYVGGYSDTKEDVFEDDTDLIQPIFEKGMMDNE